MKRNIFISLIGVETLSVGCYLWLQQHFMNDDRRSVVAHFMHHLVSPEWATILSIVGVLAIIAGATTRHKIQSVAIVVLGGLWFAYFISFTFLDFHFNDFKLSTLLTGFVFLTIVLEARYGRRL